MTTKTKTEVSGDASGRGSKDGFKVQFPARMHAFAEDEINAVLEVMRDSECQTQGQYLKKFEADFKQYARANHAFAVDNCTNALRLAAVLCGLGSGDEVIIPAYTFCATAIPFGTTGANIIWADIDPDTWVLDPTDVERKITNRTKVIVPVHLLGMPVDMPAIMDIAKKHNLKVIEDCAQAPGATINGQHVGTFGDFGCFSFHGAKNITTLGEGGILTVKSDKDAKLVPGIRHNGARPFEGKRERYWVPAMSNVDIDINGVWPNNFCIGEAQCAFGSAALKNLDKINDTLRNQAGKLRDTFTDVSEISMAKIPDNTRHVFHQFVLHFNGSSFNKNRNDLLDILVNEYKMQCIVQYYPLYRYPLFQKMDFGDQDCPVLESWWDNSFSLPWWCGVPDETLQYMVDSVKSAINILKNS
jgi:perosamine synthetase